MQKRFQTFIYLRFLTQSVGKEKRRCIYVHLLSLLFVFYKICVRVIGLEPTRLTAPDPKSGAAANYATPAGDFPLSGAKIRSFSGSTSKRVKKVIHFIPDSILL